jgi:glutathione peroxidase
MRLLVMMLATMVMATSQTAAAETAASRTAYDFTFPAIEGGPMPLAKYRGKVLLIVNTASFCGFTPQYEGLQALWSKYESKGLVVIGVPSNDFGAQEPKGEKEILSFCQGAFNVTFPLTEKQVVSGANAHPFYLWARQTLGETQAPRWNFHKYLVGRDGRLMRAFASSVAPQSDRLVIAIESALAMP